MSSSRRVLDQNWTGRTTKPSPAMYPHQWSWDSAFVAIGNAGTHWDRSVDELMHLFDAQWTNGMVPHIVFDSTVGDYQPSAAFWGSRAISAAPHTLETSGICQPAVHATAVRIVCERQPDPVERRSFATRMFEALEAWHDYLHGSRAVDGTLLEVWHPWETGMDNCPAWDGPMAALTIDSAAIDYERSDTTIAPATERPTASDYDRYVHLVEVLKQRDYQPADPRRLPFRVRDVLFNSAAAEADRDLAWLAEIAGRDGSPYLERSAALFSAIDSELWSDALGMHVSVDASTSAPIQVPIAGSLVALSGSARTERILDTLLTQFVRPGGSDGGLLIPSVPIRDPSFEANRYWRGPVWINVMWMIRRALDRCGEPDLADRVARGLLHLVAAGGVREHFDVSTLQGHGAENFSWTAALALDTLNTLGETSR